MEIDSRYSDMKRRLSLLTDAQLNKILQSLAEGQVCLDTFNYDAATQHYCPLAIAFDIPEKIQQARLTPSQALVFDMIRVYGGEAFGTVKGLSGSFYTDRRSEDLKVLCEEILNDRQ